MAGADGRSPAVGAPSPRSRSRRRRALIYPLAQVAPVVAARRRLPARRAARLDRLGRLAGLATVAAQRAGVQLLPHPADRALHDRRRARTGSRSPSSSSPPLVAQHAGRARARARARGADAPPRRPTSPPSWRALLLGGREPRGRRCRAAAQRIAQALELPSAAIELGAAAPGDAAPRRPARWASPRRHAARARGPRPGDPGARCASAIVPALEAILARRVERDALQAEVVETAGAAPQRRPQDRAAARRLARPALAADRDRRRRRGAAARPRSTRRSARSSAAVVVGEASRLSRLVDKLLDLSRLQAGRGRAAPRLVLDRGGAARGGRRRWHAARELRQLAIDARPAAGPRRRRPARARVREPARERGRATRRGEPVSVRARVVGGRLVVRVVDRGPGHPAARAGADLRAVLPRRRRARDGHAAPASGWRSSAGFVEANGGQRLRSSRCRARARRSSSSCRWSRSPRLRAR